MARRTRRGPDLGKLTVPPFPIEATEENVSAAKAFVLSKWQERHDARATEWEQAMGRPYYNERPTDLSSSCKFTSVFAAVVFGGEIEGNEAHQFAVVEGRVVDLNEDAGDVAGTEGIYRNDPVFMWSRDHKESMESCLPRVADWIGEFALLMSPEPAVPAP